MSSLEQSYCRFSTYISVKVRAFRFGVKFVFGNNIAIGLHTCGLSAAVISKRIYVKQIRRILVNPPFFLPFTRIRLEGCNQMEFRGVNIYRMSQWTYMTTKQEIERLNCDPSRNRYSYDLEGCSSRRKAGIVFPIHGNKAIAESGCRCRRLEIRTANNRCYCPTGQVRAEVDLRDLV